LLEFIHERFGLIQVCGEGFAFGPESFVYTFPHDSAHNVMEWALTSGGKKVSNFREATCLAADL
jgi:hypothetical protein